MKKILESLQKFYDSIVITSSARFFARPSKNGFSFEKGNNFDELAKSQKRHQSHAGLDPASSNFSHFWIPACAGTTVIGLFATLPILIFF